MREEKGTRRYLTTTQAARLAHLSPSTLLRAIQDKKLKAFSTPGGHFRVDRAALDVFLRDSGVPSEKKRVVHLRLSPADRDALLQTLKEDAAFNVVDAASISGQPERGARPCLVILDVSPSAKKAPVEGGVLSILQKICGLS
jgi:excisionase family DNA binding protein